MNKSESLALPASSARTCASGCWQRTSRSSASTISPGDRSRTSRAFLDHPGFRFERARLHEPARAAGGLRRLRRDRAPRGAEDPALRRRADRRSRSNVAGVNAAARRRAGSRRRPRHRVDVGRVRQRDAAVREDGELVLGPPTTRRWAYAVSKLYDEHVALALAEERGLRVTILRLFGVLRPAQPPELVGRPAGRPSSRRCWTASMMEIHGDGQQTRTFTYVTDTVDGFVRALRTPEARGEIINIGGTQPTTILDLADRGAARRMRHRRSRCARASSPTRRCRASTRTSACASRTRRRRAEMLGFTRPDPAARGSGD